VYDAVFSVVGESATIETEGVYDPEIALVGSSLVVELEGQHDFRTSPSPSMG
jgi:hypothetical protein